MQALATKSTVSQNTMDGISHFFFFLKELILFHFALVLEKKYILPLTGILIMPV